MILYVPMLLSNQPLLAHSVGFDSFRRRVTQNSASREVPKRRGGSEKACFVLFSTKKKLRIEKTLAGSSSAHRRRSGVQPTGAGLLCAKAGRMRFRDRFCGANIAAVFTVAAVFMWVPLASDACEGVNMQTQVPVAAVARGCWKQRTRVSLASRWECGAERSIEIDLYSCTIRVCVERTRSARIHKGFLGADCVCDDVCTGRVLHFACSSPN